MNIILGLLAEIYGDSTIYYLIGAKFGNWGCGSGQFDPLFHPPYITDFGSVVERPLCM